MLYEVITDINKFFAEVFDKQNVTYHNLTDFSALFNPVELKKASFILRRVNIATL